MKLHGFHYVKRAMEIAVIGNHTLTIIDCNGILASAFVTDFKAIGGDIKLITVITPCPCGNMTHSTKECTCTISQIKHYRSLKRFQKAMKGDIIIESGTFRIKDMDDIPEKASVVTARIKKAGNIQNPDIMPDSKKLLERAYTTIPLNLQQVEQIKSVATTIMNLNNSDEIKAQHIAEAIQYQMNFHFKKKEIKS